MIDKSKLCSLAIEAMKNSYSPYSNFRVGAALLTASEKVYLGSNVENAAYAVTVCAEHTAFLKAISEGEREFLAIAIAGTGGEKIDGVCAPCGVCRQVMAEFCSPDFPVLLVKGEGEFEELMLKDLLPHSFNKNNLK